MQHPLFHVFKAALLCRVFLLLWFLCFGTMFYGSPAYAGSSVRLDSGVRAGFFLKRFEADGESMLLTANSSLYRQYFATGERVTIGPAPAILPENGSRYIHVVGSSNSDQDLYSVPFDGGEVIDLGVSFYNYNPDSSPLLPDGSALIYNQDNQLKKLALTGGQPQVLVEDTSYTRSSVLLTPDASKVLMYKYKEGEQGIYSVSVEGGTPQLIAPGLGSNMSLGQFDPSGNLFITYDHWAVPLDGSQPPFQLFNGLGISSSKFTPDGSRIITMLYNDGVYTAPLDGSSPAVEIQPETSASGILSVFAATPDSQSVIINGYLASNNTRDIFAIPILGGDPLKLNISIAAGTYARPLGFTQDNHLVYDAQPLGGEERRLYSVALDGGPSLAITPSDMALAPFNFVTPDGGAVIFQGIGEDGRVTLYATSTTGGEPVPMADPFPENFYIPYWDDIQFSDDGQIAVYKIDDSTTNIVKSEYYLAGVPISRVDSGVNITGNVTGGAGFIGGIGYRFDQVDAAGTVRAEFFRRLFADLDPDLAAAIDFALTGETAQLWDMGFDGSFTGPITLSFTYDPALLGPDINEALLGIQHQLPDGSFVLLPVLDRDLDNNTITVSTDGFSSFVLCVVPEPGTLILLLPFNMLLAIRRRYEC